MSSVTQLCPTLCDPMDCSMPNSLSITNSRSLPKLMSIESVMPSNHLILCHPLLLLPSIFPSIRVFSKESVLYIKWPKYWSFSFSISPSSEYSGLISFRIDWFDLLSVQGTLKIESSLEDLGQGGLFANTGSVKQLRRRLASAIPSQKTPLAVSCRQRAG